MLLLAEETLFVLADWENSNEWVKNMCSINESGSDFWVKQGVEVLIVALPPRGRIKQSLQVHIWV